MRLFNQIAFIQNLEEAYIKDWNNLLVWDGVLPLEKCGLSEKYSSTHFIRHTMATITRHVTGSLESVQSVTGHKDQRLVQHYAALNTDIQKDALIQVENFLQLDSWSSPCQTGPSSRPLIHA